MKAKVELQQFERFLLVLIVLKAFIVLSLTCANLCVLEAFGTGRTVSGLNMQCLRSVGVEDRSL